YDTFRAAAEHALRRTNIPEAPWHVVEGTHGRYRALTTTDTLRKALEERLQKSGAAESAAPEKPPLPEPEPVNVINQLDLSRTLDDDAYRKELAKYQGRLSLLSRQLQEQQRSLTVVLEGPDAAGKGGAIRRMTAAMDARHYRVITVSAPTQEEHAQHYLWRFWRNVPRRGRITIYDRSWYGRVLVERLEGYAKPDAWQRAYGEINAFEEQLVESGTVLLKFWLAISAEEQLKRFKAREQTSYKQYKITEDDWRNREKGPAYEAAACDMIEQTSTEFAPWTLVEGDHKRWARIKVLRTTCERLESALRGGGT
ncbi:MAG TPA: polyphosphate:AMP phosphotransferase, partial [Armatimonadota bacterium]|nr:polyphosphate:AMP phosphotransferase [Armatimonadota bacterium]